MKQVLISAIMDKMIPAFGWMLIHSLWQGLLIAIIAGAVLMMAKKAKPAYRYNIMLALFGAFLGACACTFVYELNRTASAAFLPLIPGTAGSLVPSLFFGNVHSLKQFINIFADYFSANEPLVVLVWFIFFLFKSVKMLTCLVYNRQVRTRQVSGPPEFWAKKVAEFSQKLQIKKAVTLLQSDYIKMPVVVGHLKPVILIPVGLMAGLPAEQVEAILLHELAHIRRNDYFVNFLQNIAETVFFFNPGLLWISALLREERENCCDDMALEQTQNKTGFVQALISFKEYELYGSGYAVAFPGKKNYLLRRVSRIMDNKSLAFGLGEKIFFAGSILLLSVFVTVASVAQVREYAKSEIVNAHKDKTVRQKTVAENHSIAKAIKTEIKRVRAKVRRKMPDDIAAIKEKVAPVEAVAAIVPAVTPLPVNNQKAVSEKDQAQKDQVQARSAQEQARIDQLQAMNDRLQALKDQAQAKIDQAEALKDQAQGQLDQEQAKKDRQAQNQLQADKNKQQAIRNEEQARLNQVQAKKNHEQDERNEEQARLNKIQVKKNQEQAAKNQEQARLNEIQVKKNQEQARKNIAGVQ